MKKVSLILLILLVCFSTLLCTSCGARSDGESSFYEKAITFIYGETDAANYFLNIDPFSTTKAMATGIVNTWNIIVSSFAPVFSWFVHNILYILLAWVIAIVITIVLLFITGIDILAKVAGFLIVFVPLYPLLLVAIVALLALIVIIALFAYAVLFDLAIIVYAVLAILFFGLARYLEYFFVDLGLGEKLLKAFVEGDLK